MKVFVTGATGFIGRHLVQRLSQAGYRIRCLVRNEKHVEALQEQGFEVVLGEVNDPETVMEGLLGCDVMVHLANVYSMWLPEPAEFNEVNVHGTKVVMECACRSGIQRAVYVSTVAVYGCPNDQPFTEESEPGRKMLSRYAETKAEGNRLAWEIANENKLPFTVMYPGIVLGAGDDKASGQYIQDIIFRRVPSTIYHSSFAVYVYVEDLVDAIIQALARPEAAGQRYLIGKECLDGKSYANLIGEVSGVSLPWFHFPDFIVTAASYLFTTIAGFTGRAPWWGLSIDAARTLRAGFRFEAAKSERELGISYSPIRLALEEAVKFYRERESPNFSGNLNAK